MDVNSANLRALDLGFSAAFRAGFGQAAVDYEQLALRSPSMTREEQYDWLGQFPGLREWVGERVVRGIATHGYSLENRLYEDTVSVLRTKIEDDQHGQFGPIFRMAGEAAAAHPCQLVYGALLAGFWTECYDGQYFFDSDHEVDGASVSNVGGAPARVSIETGIQRPWFLMCLTRPIKPLLWQPRVDYAIETKMDLHSEATWRRDEFEWGIRGRCAAGYGLWQMAYGSVEPLTEENYRAGKAVLYEALGDAGRNLGYVPTHLVIPTQLEHSAYQLLNADRLENGASNVYKNDVQLIKSPWLNR